MGEYGIPYMGSKGGIANKLIRLFPKAENFYDLFGGGFSVTHAMLLRRSKDYKQFHFNEIRPGICELVKDAIAGKYNYDVFKPKFVDRDEFSKLKEVDAYVKMIWSFGNNGEDYLFSKDIEPYKKSMHNAIVFNDFDTLAKQVLGMEKFNEGYSIKSKRLFLRNKIEYYQVTKIPEILHQFLNEQQLERLQQLEQLQQLERLQQLEQLQQIQRLERLQRLQQIEQLQQIEFYTGSYDQVPIKENSIIYCDIPYQGTADYGGFDHKQFFDWAASQKQPVFISEYDIDDKRFKQIAQFKKRSMISANKKKCFSKLEKVYANEAARRLNGKA